MDRAYAAVYRNLYQRHWWWRARERYLLERLEQQHREGSSPSILDVGCGDALFFDRLDRFGDVHGIEPDESLLSDGPWRSRIHLGTLDAQYSAGHKYEWILMFDVLEHVEEYHAFLTAAREALVPQGQLFVTVPALPALWTSHDNLNQHYRRYTRRTLSRALTAAGLKPVEMEYFFHWIVPLKLLTRLREKLRRPTPTPETVPPEPLNGVAYAISRLEQRVPGMALLPFGTSLFARCKVAGVEQ